MVMAIKVNIPGFLLVLVVVGGRGGGLGYPSTNQKNRLASPISPPLLCHQNVDFEIFMQFLGILSKMSPTSQTQLETLHTAG